MRGRDWMVSGLMGLFLGLLPATAVVQGEAECLEACNEIEEYCLDDCDSTDSDCQIECTEAAEKCREECLAD